MTEWGQYWEEWSWLAVASNADSVGVAVHATARAIVVADGVGGVKGEFG